MALSVALPATGQEPGGAQLVSCATGLGEAGPFEPSCRSEGGELVIRDPEFNSEHLLAVWQENGTSLPGGGTADDGRIWFARIDPFTGAIRPEATLSVAGRPARLATTGNGPEWAFSRRGPEAFYTCVGPTPVDVQLCKVARTPSGIGWEVLADSLGLMMSNPSRNSADPQPKVYWKTPDADAGGLAGRSTFGWREDSAQAADVAMDTATGIGVWLPDASGLVVSRYVLSGGSPVNQLHLYDTVTGTAEQILFDDRDRRGAVPWAAPELGGGLAISALVRDPETGGLDLEVYRQDSAGDWVLWAAIPPVCPGYFSSYSAEPFVHAGRSYLSVASYAGTEEDRDPGVVWIASVDPSLPEEDRVHRLLSPAACGGVDLDNRRDPESLVLPGGRGVRIFFVQTPGGF